MARATIPVDLTNPGQVFACLGFMEAAEILCGPCTGKFDYESSETQTTFTFDVDGPDDPARAAIDFLARAEAKALVPNGSSLSTASWKIAEVDSGSDPLGGVFPSPVPGSPAALPAILTDGAFNIPVAHWADDFSATSRDNAKFWAGAAGYPGAALARDAIKMVAELGGNAIAAAAGDPFSVSGPQSSSFRFDWRRDYVPLDVGFAPNAQAKIKMVGYPLVELLAAIGMEHARPERPDRRDKLAYRYGVSNVALPTPLARIVLGAGHDRRIVPARTFRIKLGWPGQEGQARCIIDAKEEFAP